MSIDSQLLQRLGIALVNRPIEIPIYTRLSFDHDGNLVSRSLASQSFVSLVLQIDDLSRFVRYVKLLGIETEKRC